MKKNVFLTLSVVLLGMSACDMTVAMNGNQAPTVRTIGGIIYSDANYRAAVNALRAAQNDAQQLRDLIGNNQLPGAGAPIYVDRTGRVTDVRPPFDVQNNRDLVGNGFFEIDPITWALFDHSIVGSMIRQIPGIMIQRALAVANADVRMDLVNRAVQNIGAAEINVVGNMMVPVELYRPDGNDIVNMPVLAARVLPMLQIQDANLAYRLLHRLGLDNDASFTAIYRALNAVSEVNGQIYGDVVCSIETLETVADEHSINIDRE